jgi:transposase
MDLSRRVFTREFKMAVMKELQTGRPVAVVARRLQIGRDLLYRWKREFTAHPATAFSGLGNRVESEGREAELERKIGQLTIEVDFLKKLLKTFEAQLAEEDGGKRSTKRSGKRKTSR